MNKVLLLAGLCTLWCATSCKNQEKKTEEEANLLVTAPLQTDTSITKDYVCQVRSIKHIELRAQERGYLERSYVDEGSFVKKGQLLFKIMPNLYEAELKEAQAEVSFANIEYKNAKQLADNKVVSQNELAMAKAKLDKAKAQLSLKEVHLQFTEIRAPFDGIIDRLEVRPGSLVEEGELMTTLADNSKMWVYFNVPEAEYLDYATQPKGEKAQVQLLMANHQLFTHPGVVETIEADFDNETGNIPFRATFPNPNGLLRHGQTGNVRMTIPLKNSLIIPQKATFEVLDKKYVFVVDKDKRIKTREISVGAEMDDLYAVTSGLSAKDQILLEGLRKDKENDKIAFEFEQPKEAISHLRLPAE